MPPHELDEEERVEKLAEDGQSPFQPADPPDEPAKPADDVGQGDNLDDTHPVTDDQLDTQELYDEGVSGAAEAEEPNMAPTPDEDNEQRR